MLHTINKNLIDEGLPVEKLDEVFEKWWPDLNAKLSQITTTASTAQPLRRSAEDVLEEIVSTIRENSHTQSTSLNAVSHVLNVLEPDRSEFLRIRRVITLL